MYELVLFQLVSNAVKFSDVGSCIVVSLTISQSQETILLKTRVTDTGSGIQENRLRLMHGALNNQVEAQSDVIQKADKSGEKPLGFGLTTANQFVQYLGGELRFKSFPWFKTEAIFSFPIKLMMMPKS